ncbi:MAG: CHRD domain-containing protein [Methylocella sp.]
MTTLRTFACAMAFAAGALVLSSGAYAQSPLGAPLFAVLNGGNECNSDPPPAGPACRKGDLDGIGSATILFPAPTAVCFAIIVDNLAGATLAHIHSGVAGVNGAIVVTLFPPAAAGGGNPGVSSGCVTAVPAATVTAIRDDPTSFYVNVHNATFPAGAVRGQLH